MVTEKKRVVEKYREVTLTQISYKICILILIERLKKEMKEKTTKPPNQTKFRKGINTIKTST